MEIEVHEKEFRRVAQSWLVILSEAKDRPNHLPLSMSSARSIHSGFCASINTIFLERSHPLICFSRAIASLHRT